jgi:hypothetical protein
MFKKYHPTLVEKVLAFLGWGFIGIGLLCNQWVLAKLFASDGVIASSYKIPIIWFFQAICILIGYIIINRRNFANLLRTTSQRSHFHPKLFPLLFGTIFFIILLAMTEGLFYIVNTMAANTAKEEWYSSGSLFANDERLGYKILPNVHVYERKKFDDELAFEATYSTDEYGRRITPVEHDEERDNFLLFFGDSFVFGQGVNDNETLPFYMAELAPQYKPYNYGVMGYGPQGMLAKLQDNQISKEIDKDKGILVYIIINDHFIRAIGSMRVHNTWGHSMPFYALDAHDKLIRKGNFTSGRPLVSLVYRGLGTSQILRFFGIDLHGNITDNHVAMTARIIEESRNIFLKKFKSNRFYVLFFPNQKETRRLIPALRSADIEYVDYVDLFAVTQEGFEIKNDGHPTPKAYKTIATRLAKDLNIGGGHAEEQGPQVDTQSMLRIR